MKKLILKLTFSSPSLQARMEALEGAVGSLERFLKASFPGPAFRVNGPLRQKTIPTGYDFSQASPPKVVAHTLWVSQGWLWGYRFELIPRDEAYLAADVYMDRHPYWSEFIALPALILSLGVLVAVLAVLLDRTGKTAREAVGEFGLGAWVTLVVCCLPGLLIVTFVLWGLLRLLTAPIWSRYTDWRRVEADWKTLPVQIGDHLRRDRYAVSSV
jgi:hypothetical protein